MSLRRSLLILLFVLSAQSVSAQIAYDAALAPAGGTGTLSWTLTPVGVPKGLLVMLYCEDATDCADAVTADGITVPEVSCSPNLPTAGLGSTYAFFLGSGIPNEALSMQITVLTAGDKRAIAVSYTATAAATEIIDCDGTIDSASVANPSVVLSLGGRTAWAGIVAASGQASISSITELTDWSPMGELDFGTTVGGAYRYNTVGTADVTAGWTQLAEDAVAIAVAVSETQASTRAPRCPMLGAC